MKILIAEDDLISRSLLERTLKGWGHEVVVTSDGLAAWNVLKGEDAPKLAILDWMMPELEGPEICRRVRDLETSEPIYLILLTAKHQKEDTVRGLESGANDYVMKPFDRRELLARIDVGRRVVALQHSLSERVSELERALAEVKTLKGMLPICSYCKKIRGDDNYWQRIETYMAAHADVQFSHGVCPDCYEVVLQELAEHGIN